MILVAGLGNIFLGDDAFGCEVVRALAAQELPECVRVKEFGIRTLDLAFELLHPYDAIFLVDAASGGGAPWSIYVIDPLAGEEPAVVAAGAGVHEMNPMRTIELARQMGATLRHIRIIGCEPETFGAADEGQMGLSSCVATAVQQTLTVIHSLIEEVSYAMESL